VNCNSATLSGKLSRTTASPLLYKQVLYFMWLLLQPIPAAARSKALDCGRLLTGSTGSKCASHGCLCLVSVVRWRSLRRADRSCRGVLLSGVCLEWNREASIMRRPWPTRGCWATKKKYCYNQYPQSKYSPMHRCYCNFSNPYSTLAHTEVNYGPQIKARMEPILENPLVTAYS
jgi:hypothetical protein